MLETGRSEGMSQLYHDNREDVDRRLKEYAAQDREWRREMVRRRCSVGEEGQQERMRFK